MRPVRVPARRLPAVVLAAAVLGALAPALPASATVPAGTSGPTSTTAAIVVPGKRVEVRRLPSDGVARPPGASRQLTSAAPPGPARSTWQVRYTGFTPQAQVAFQRAVDIWASLVASPVPITVSADFQVMAAGVLGSAGPATLRGGDVGDGATLYPIALAEALKAVNLNGTAPDIAATFSSSAAAIYYGTDGQPPAGSVDFVSVVMHELGHGLGFVASASFDPATGKGSRSTSLPYSYDGWVVDARGTWSFDPTYPAASTALGSLWRSGSVFWDGPAGRKAAGGRNPQLYAPAAWDDGSSISHLDEGAFPRGSADALMTPFVQDGEVVHSAGPVTLGMLSDMGWTVGAATVPSAPTAATASATGPGEVAVSFTAPAADGGVPVTSYTVTSAPDGLTVTGPASPLTVAGLRGGQPYTFTVVARNAVGSGPPSAATAPVTPVTAPGAPTAVTAVGADAGAQVSWTAPSWTGGTALTGWVVTATAEGQPPASTPVTGTATTAAVGGLVNGLPYAFTVSAVNAVGTGPASAGSTPVTPTGGPTVASAPRSVTAVAGTASAEVSWSPALTDGGSPLLGYVITASTGGPVVVAAPDATGASFPGLANGAPVTFTVRARNAQGDGPSSFASATVVPSDVPDQVLGVVVVPGHGNLKVSWTSPGDGGSALTGFVIRRAGATDQPVAASQRSATVGGLTNGVDVALRVVALNARGEGSPSEVVTGRPLASLLTTTITSGPATGSALRSTSAAFAFTSADASYPATPRAATCRLDGGAPTACTSPRSYSGLGQGLHSFTVQVTGQDGRTATATRSWRVDTVAPVAVPGAVAWTSFATTVALPLSGTDSGSGVASFDARYRRVAWNATTFSAYTSPSGWVATRATSVRLPTSAGSTSCLSMRARDRAGNVSTWSAERCTASPLNDVTLMASSGWVRSTAAAFANGSALSSRTKGATATRTGVVARRVALVTTTCRGCGSLDVLWNGRVVKTLSTAATTTSYRRVLVLLVLPGAGSGTIQVRKRDTGLTHVDGLVVLRY